MNGRIVNGQKLKQDDDDILRKLPEGLLHHILSFLDIKDVVRTSILSKRWEFIWTSTPNLIFDVPDLEETSPSFLNFVDRALFLRDSPIKMFSIDATPEFIDPLRLRGWISAVVRHNVEELYLDLVSIDRLEILDVPCRLFTCASLTHLTIFTTFWLLKFPPSICLSSLKYLMLKLVTIGDAESMRSLISGCPQLDTLCLIGCEWPEGEMFYICAPKLCKLIITELLENDDRMSCGFMISGPSLKHFQCEGDFLYNYCLYDVPFLEEGHIHLIHGDGPDGIVEEIEFSTRLCKLLKGFSHLKVLSLPFKAIKGFNNQTDLLHNLPLFNNVNFLTLTGVETEIDCKGLTMILQHCPRLETICFNEGVGLSSHCNTDQGVLEPVPPCFLSHLKTIEINFSRSNRMNVDGLNPDQKVFVAAVKILLKRAPLLEKLILYITKEDSVLRSLYPSSYDLLDADADADDDDDDDQVMDVGALIKKLRKLCRASRLCRIQLAVPNSAWFSSRFW